MLAYVLSNKYKFLPKLTTEIKVKSGDTFAFQATKLENLLYLDVIFTFECHH